MNGEHVRMKMLLTLKLHEQDGVNGETYQADTEKWIEQLLEVCAYRSQKLPFSEKVMFLVI